MRSSREDASATMEIRGRRRSVAPLLMVALLTAGPGAAQEASRQDRVGARYVGSQTIAGPAAGAVRQQRDRGISVGGRRVTLPPGVQRGPVAAGEPVIVQFEAPPAGADRARIRRRGFRFIDFISDTASWVRAERRADLEGIPGLRSALRPTPDVKIGPQLERALAARDPGAEIPVQVGFFDDVPEVAVRAALRQVGVGATGAEVLVGNRVRLRADRSRILSLAEHPAVRALELGGIGKRTHNLNNLGFVRADEARDRFRLSGDGVHVGVWDEGPADADHVEFGGRVSVVDDGEPSLHATHVTGTIAARGDFSFAAGLAPETLTHSYDFDGDVAGEMRSAREDLGVVIANNSWGLLVGWEFTGRFHLGGPIMSWFGDENFGRYTMDSRALDQLVRDFGLTVVFAGGNHRNDAVRAHAYYDVVEDRVVSRRVDERDGPYTSIDPFATAKNVIAVGATAAVSHMTPFSSWGPTRDGRIKPEITAPGLGVFSTANDDGYEVLSGTSMATATASGALALLVELWRRGHRGNDPSPAVLRNVLVATAVDADEPGPDYRFGYGTIDVAAAAELLRGSRRVLIEGSIEDREEQTFRLRIGNGVESVRVTLAWLDPPGPELVNDLDVVVIPRSGREMLPWRLDPRSPEGPASRGVNTADNVEVVDVESLPGAAGARNGWEIRVSAPRLGSGSSQDYVLTILAR